jgi:hypothetical protein
VRGEAIAVNQTNAKNAIILIEDVCQKRMHLQQRIACQGQTIRNLIRKDLNANVRRTAGGMTRMLAIAGELQHTNTENAKSRLSNCEERDRELGYRR